MFPLPRLSLTGKTGLTALATASLLLSSWNGMAQSTGDDWKKDAPGVRHEITVAEIPEPFATQSVHNPPSIVPVPKEPKLRVPAGFEVSEYARGFKNPRFLLVAPNGDLLVTESGRGEIRILRDSDGDGKPDLNERFLSGLKQPFGLAFYPPGPAPTHLYIANTDGIVRVPYKEGDLEASAKPEPIAPLSSGGRLTGGGHWTRDIAFSNDGTLLYASVGSKTNVDERHEAVENERARIFVMKPDGSEMRPYATGVRNAVGIAVHPTSGELWASVNERDGLGDDLVPDYITRIKEGGFYGWPWYYLGNHLDPRHRDDPHPELAQKVIVPDVLVQAHSATLNMVFYTGEAFPQEYRGDAFAAFHGSWNRDSRTGYKVVRVPLKDGKPQGYYEDFLTGFILPDGDVWGRPVGLAVAKDGSLLVSEDGNNVIWKVNYKP